MKTDFTETWKLYQQGRDFKSQIDLYNIVNVNERFMAGDHWYGIPHEGLPAPVCNVLRIGVQNAVALVNEHSLTMSFSSMSDTSMMSQQIDPVMGQPIEKPEDKASMFLTNWAKAEFERQNMQYMILEGLEDAAVTGDFIYYAYWDDSEETGQAFKGDIKSHRIDNVNYYPGNPNSADVQSQPYIIIAFRELVKNVQELAKKNGIPKSEINLISSDYDNLYTAGDRGKIEINDTDKCILLLKMWKKNGKVWFEKSTQNVIVAPEKETKLTLYPIEIMNWWPRKNSCHGTAPLSQCISNQVYLNKSMAMSQFYAMNCAFPKIIFDKGRIKTWSNKVAAAIGVNGDISGAADYMNPPQMSFDMYKMFDITKEITLQMLGANDILLGNIDKPDNTSAFIAIRESAAMPMRSIQLRLYRFLEGIGKIWFDFFSNYYEEGRAIPVLVNGAMQYVTIPTMEPIRGKLFNLKIDVGPANVWSETTTIQTLDNMRAQQMIDDVDYIERLPKGLIPMQDSLLLKKKEQQAQIQAQAQQLLEQQITSGGMNV
jgi:hypothetical protein